MKNLLFLLCPSYRFRFLLSGAFDSERARSSFVCAGSRTLNLPLTADLGSQLWVSLVWRDVNVDLQLSMAPGYVVRV
jgi:hypothetical protein